MASWHDHKKEEDEKCS